MGSFIIVCKLDGDAEKRGGKGGGDWPEMKELKFWMQEVEEVATEFTTEDQDAADADDDEESNDLDNDYYLQPTTLPSNSFDSGYLLDTPAVPNTCMPNIHLNLDNTDIYDLQMPFDLSGAQQGRCLDVDSSMFDGSANSFPYQSDPLLGIYQDPATTTFLQSSSFGSDQDFAQFSHPGSFIQ